MTADLAGRLADLIRRERDAVDIHRGLTSHRSRRRASMNATEHEKRADAVMESARHIRELRDEIAKLRAAGVVPRVVESAPNAEVERMMREFRGEVTP